MTTRSVKHIGAAIAVILTLAATACTPDRPDQQLWPQTPSGATLIPGGPMEPTPKVTNPKIPASQQEARDTVLKYLQQSVDALPAGSTLDGSRYVVGTGTTYCEDEPTDQNSPVHFEDWRDINLPPATDFNATIAHLGDVWKQWGWQVLERDGFAKPNRFGYAPDGYTLQIEARTDPKFAPSLIGASPCFPGNLRDDSLGRNPGLIVQSTPTS